MSVASIERNVRRPNQIFMHCPCGKSQILAKGLCSTCYSLKRQDVEYFDGHREEVLRRDDYRCRVPGCLTIKRGKRSVAVHHRQPGNSDPAMMITLCLPCHAKISRTRYVSDDWPEFLRVLWREQHPRGHEQTSLDFSIQLPVERVIPLFDHKESRDETSRTRRDDGRRTRRM
jgi:hypothetical protein